MNVLFDPKVNVGREIKLFEVRRLEMISSKSAVLYCLNDNVNISLTPLKSGPCEAKNRRFQVWRGIKEKFSNKYEPFQLKTLIA